MILMNIPAHTNCTNCGKCCGLVPATVREVAAIRDYIAEHGIRPVHHSDRTICPFRDDVQKMCLIYPVRPVVCRLFGVSSGCMMCPNGNSACIDGSVFLPDPEQIIVLNLLQW